MNYRSIRSRLDLLLSGNGDALLESLAKEERDLLLKILDEIKLYGESKFLDYLWLSDFTEKPVSIDQFLEDDYYLGKVGKGVYQIWRKELRYISDPSNEIFEWIIRGSIGSGKTTIAIILLLYRIYWLLCLKDPSSYYGLLENSPIVFALFNIYKYLVMSTSYNYLVSWTNLSEFFLERGIVEGYKESSIMKFRNNINLALGSQSVHALGQNLLGGLCDEADLGKSKSSTDDELSQVAAMYAEVRSRMDSRFIQKGGANPGILILVSQVKGRSFLDSHVKRVSSDPRTIITSYPLWVVKSDRFDMSKTFKVVVGNRQQRSFIATNETDIEMAKLKGLQIIDVPEELRARFEYDINEAIQNIAGIPTYGTNLFLSRRDRLYRCYDLATPREHPFTVDTTELSIEENDTHTLIDIFDKSKCMDQLDMVTGNHKPRFFPGSERAIHIDLSVSKDAAGFSMGAIGDLKDVTRFDLDGKPYTTRAYNIFIDLALRIKATKGSEIDFSKIRQFIFFLYSIGFPIRWISFDGFQSVDSAQILKKAGFEVKILSVDKNPTGYNYLKSCITELRFDMYRYEPFIEEITQLEDHTLTKRKPAIDHPPKGSKDVADSIAGVVTRLTEEISVLHQETTDDYISNVSDIATISAQADRKIDIVKRANLLTKTTIRKSNLANMFGDD